MATKQEVNLEKALEQALRALEVQGRRKTAAWIRPIIFENLRRGGYPGRVQNYLKNNPKKKPADYVALVARNYEKLGSYLRQLQKTKSDRVWKPLFVEMQWSAYNFLRRNHFYPGDQTFQMAEDCAADAACDLVQAYYPYDTEFDAWVCTIVQNHCKKAITRLLRAGHLPDNKKVSLTDSAFYQYRTADPSSTQLMEWRLALMQLIELLPFEEQEAVQLHNYKGLTFQEIGQQLGISTATAHRRYFSAVAFLRENLTQEYMVER